MEKIGAEYVVANSIEWRATRLGAPSVLVGHLAAIAHDVRNVFKKQNRHIIFDCSIDDIDEMTCDYFDWFDKLYVSDIDKSWIDYSGLYCPGLYKVSLRPNRTLKELRDRFAPIDEDIQLLQKIINRTLSKITYGKDLINDGF